MQAVTPGISDEEVAAQITHVEDRAFNDVRYYIDSSKLQALGWKCQVSFEEGFELSDPQTFAAVIPSSAEGNVKLVGEIAGVAQARHNHASTVDLQGGKADRRERHQRAAKRLLVLPGEILGSPLHATARKK